MVRVAISMESTGRKNQWHHVQVAFGLPSMTITNADELTEKDLINKMAAVMAASIAKLLQPCIEQRCKQFLTLMNEGGMFDGKL
jgi:hypothetical protein